MLVWLWFELVAVRALLVAFESFQLIVSRASRVLIRSPFKGASARRALDARRVSLSATGANLL